MEKDDEVKGNGNSIDYGARIYDPRLGRWTAIDLRFREYVPISPYVFGLNNPIYFKDADGNIIVDKNGHAVTVGPPVKQQDGTYTSSFSFVDGTKQDVIDKFNESGGRVINAMIQTPTGREQVQKAIDSKNNIHVTVSPKNETELIESRDPNNPTEKVYKEATTFGKTGVTAATTNSDGSLVNYNIEVTIYEGTIKYVEKSSSTERAKSWKENGATPDQKVAGVAGHEFEHATNPVHVDNLLNKNKPITDEQHEDADRKHDEIIKESGENNKKK